MKRYRARNAMVGTLAVLALLVSCSNVSNFISVYTKHYLGIPYAPIDPASVEILRTDPSRPNVRLGEVVIESEGNLLVADMEQKIREASGKMGANAAVVVFDTTNLMGPIKVGQQWEREIPPEGRKTIIVAIRYREE